MVDNENVVENENDQDVKKRARGKGRSWIIITEYPSLPDGFTHIESLNRPVVSRLKGRITRGKTNAYYYL
jgi:NAD-dependent oxidoreductase involved in siderophore biosynthesis